MKTDQQQLELEQEYLMDTLIVIHDNLLADTKRLDTSRQQLTEAQRDMWETSGHSSDDLEKINEANQHLGAIAARTENHQALESRIEKSKQLLSSPYFARVDFIPEGFKPFQIYIGQANVANDRLHKTFVYDWRAPVASLFYRFETGAAEYTAPRGQIKGEITLKRQYEIKDGELKFFFDSSVNITDDILRSVLAQNSSEKMKSIVETIQRDQDKIIRDVDSELLIVQGAAGSGKTAVALHRVAYLLYQGLANPLKNHNILLISPNQLFGQYVANVLPELGEKNIDTITFEILFADQCNLKHDIQNRTAYWEQLITCPNPDVQAQMRNASALLMSQPFMQLLERYIWTIEHRLIDFTDVYYDNRVIFDREELKAFFLNKNKRFIPPQKRLDLLESRISDRLQELHPRRMAKLMKFVAEQTEHDYEAKSFTRLLAMKQSGALFASLHRFTKLDPLGLLQNLFRDKALFHRLAVGLELPDGIDSILDYVSPLLQNHTLPYFAGILLLYWNLRLCGCSTAELKYKDIKQVLVDEAQDYDPMHYMILNQLFPNAKYTILGDINQTIEKDANFNLYDQIRAIFCRTKSSTMLLNKSFRCSYEINRFSAQFLDQFDTEHFDRHEEAPKLQACASPAALNIAVLQDLAAYTQNGYGACAILCKSARQAKAVYEALKDRTELTLLTERTCDTVLGNVVLPIYLAKGLEFDAVLLYQVNDVYYHTVDDRKLLYIGSTRALHRLSLYYSGERSPLLTLLD